ncbi:aminopeptidase [Tepidibacter formicigenes]|uniref:M18 family aminopeptidase n=1 Tax=Tepidibacter formicigenes DSM 15518 TaxID=1123349 RepID=A0A1M6K5K4_9FIRM|nr:aminopeptidase [Tepidibacter formicigenes]SHJ54223.1 Aspartyl aminopeptidase [Tepidibacter formicigenes DSM 15518]
MNLNHEFKSAWNNLKDGEMDSLMNYSKEYMNFLDNGKTERRCVEEIIKKAKEKGFISLEEAIKGGKLQSGCKIYANNKEKGVALFVIGKESLEKGMKVVGAHVDSPRLDLKPFPLYEDGNLALLKTHYYGGIKKYQWTSIPLSLHGVVFKKDGTKVDINIGEDENDPVLYITDLLIHLAKDQMGKKLSEGITGEGLNVIIGHIPMKDKEKNAVKENILKLLNGKYGITEEDFVTAEIEVVPAGKARDVGIDRSMIASYGHDDRVCTFAGFKSILEIENPKYTAVGLFVDKEEVGSMGNTGMESRFFENTVAELINLEGNYNDLKLRRALANSKVLSADVTCGFDPNFPDVVDKRNAAFMGHGVVITKYTGARGKGGCNDANAEFVSEIRQLFNENEVTWQIGELGKVDQGGGGTIAYILANYGAEVIDCGVPVLSMHAPIEVVSKVDCYETYKAYKAFLK